MVRDGEGKTLPSSILCTKLQRRDARITRHIGPECLLNEAKQESVISYDSELLVTLLEKLAYLEPWA